MASGIHPGMGCSGITLVSDRMPNQALQWTPPYARLVGSSCSGAVPLNAAVRRLKTETQTNGTNLHRNDRH